MELIAASVSIIFVNLTIDAKQIFDSIWNISICPLKHAKWQF